MTAQNKTLKSEFFPTQVPGWRSNWDIGIKRITNKHHSWGAFSIVNMTTKQILASGNIYVYIRDRIIKYKPPAGDL